MTQSVITFREAQGNFFDRQRVQSVIGKEVAGAMVKIGAFTRTTIQRSIRPARRMKLSEMPESMAATYQGDRSLERPFASSKPGEPPRGRTRRLRRSIFFAFDPHTNSAVVGPIRFPGSRSAHAPSVLEFGGESTVTLLKTRHKKHKGQPATDAQREGLLKARREGKLKPTAGDTETIEVPVRIAARPYVGPALNVVRPRIAPQFRNLIR